MTRAFLLAAGVLALSSKVQAQDAVPPDSGGAEPSGSAAQAAESFALGVSAVERSDWPAAREAFRGAYDASGRALILVNLALVEIEMRDYVSAAQNYRQFLASGDPEATPEQRAEVQRAVINLEERLARVEVSTPNASADGVVTVDGRQLLASELTGLELNPGRHVFTLREGGQEVARTELSLREGARDRVVLQRADQIVTPPPPPHPPAPGVEGESSIWSSPWLWGGAALVIAAGATVAIVAWPEEELSDPYVGTIPPGRWEVY